MASTTDSSSILPAFRVVEQCRVSPCGDGPLAAGEELSLPLTFFDVPWLGRRPVELLFFYRWPGLTTPHFAASALPCLRRSLALALHRYYPLAGRLRPPRPAPSSDKFHICCADGDSVSLALAECIDGGRHFEQLAGDDARCVHAFRPLVPEIPMAVDDGGMLALTALQVTVFPGAGVCVGVSIHHAACDGSGFMSFVRTWASACGSGEEAAAVPPAGELPVIDRTLVSDPRELYTVFCGMKPMTSPGKVHTPTDHEPAFVRSTFLLRRAHVEELRRRASEQMPPPPPLLRYSTFVLTCAYVWVNLLKVRGEEQPPKPDEGVGNASYFDFVVDCRGRLSPPLPAAYFGNCLGLCFVDARRSDLLGKGGVGCAVEAIAESLARMGKDGQVLQGAEEWIPKLAVRQPGRVLSVAGSPSFRVYGVDFGWGRPAKVEVMGIERSGAVALVESREEDGGIEVGLALTAPEMSRFTSLFAAGLEDK